MGPRRSRVQERIPDLLILDLSMPGLSGFEVCRAVKADPRTARVPVLMLTGESDVERKVEGFEAGADDYLAKPFDPRELRARVGALVRLVRREADRNPTTGLPGSRAIDEELTRRATAGHPFAVIYLDIDNFKPFNDVFGFAVADAVIREAGDVLHEAVAATGGTAGPNGEFVGHIGGDDFILVSDPPRGEALARACVERFRRRIEAQVGPVVTARGSFTGPDRGGIEREFPLATLTAVVLHVEPARWRSVIDLGARAADAKRRAKAQGVGRCWWSGCDATGTRAPGATRTAAACGTGARALRRASIARAARAVGRGGRGARGGRGGRRAGRLPDGDLGRPHAARARRARCAGRAER
jgi:diguanylate cyclase (GGDEF)-like protein